MHKCEKKAFTRNSLNVKSVYSSCIYGEVVAIVKNKEFQEVTLHLWQIQTHLCNIYIKLQLWEFVLFILLFCFICLLDWKNSLWKGKLTGAWKIMICIYVCLLCLTLNCDAETIHYSANVWYLPSECIFSLFPQSASSFNEMESPSSSYEKPQAFEGCECFYNNGHYKLWLIGFCVIMELH